jgi:hypothetical protein
MSPSRFPGERRTYLRKEVRNGKFLDSKMGSKKSSPL